MATIREAMSALELVVAAVQWIRSRAARALPARHPGQPTAAVLTEAFARLESDDAADRDVAPVRRWTFYGVLRGGFASHTLGPLLREVLNRNDEPVGELVFIWMRQQFQRYDIDPDWIGSLEPRRAAEWAIATIQMFLMRASISSCDPENLELEACRGPHPTDTEYITTVTAAGDYPRTVAQLAQVYDPRQWSLNPYAVHFKDVHPVTNVNGNVPQPRAEPMGTSWNGWISEHVEGPGGSFLINTLQIQFAVTSAWILFTYDLGKTIGSSGTLSVERDFGYLSVVPVSGRAGWCRVDLQKNVKFSGIMGSSGGDIGWGDLANLIAPDLIANWLSDMSHAPCWTPP